MLLALRLLLVLLSFQREQHRTAIIHFLIEDGALL